MLSKDLDPDMVVVEGSMRRPSRVIIVEFQRAEDAGKLRQWPRYAAAKWLRYECPVDVLVICPDEKTADWFARPIRTDLDEYTHWPTVLRSAQVPALTVGRQAALAPHHGYPVPGLPQGREEGHAAGLIEGERGTIHMVLKARGLEVSAANRERLDSCTILDTLKRWSQAALTASTADEVFTT